MNIITRQSEIYIAEMVESYHNMNNNDAEHLNEFTHRLRDESRSHIKDGLYIRRQAIDKQASKQATNILIVLFYLYIYNKNNW